MTAIQEAKTQNPQKYLECCATALPAEYVSSHISSGAPLDEKT
jgi:hypothetical protein